MRLSRSAVYLPDAPLLRLGSGYEPNVWSIPSTLERLGASVRVDAIHAENLKIRRVGRHIEPADARARQRVSPSVCASARLDSSVRPYESGEIRAERQSNDLTQDVCDNNVYPRSTEQPGFACFRMTASPTKAIDIYTVVPVPLQRLIVWWPILQTMNMDIFMLLFVVAMHAHRRI